MSFSPKRRSNDDMVVEEIENFMHFTGADAVN